MTLVIKKPTANQLVLRQTYVGTDDPDAAAYIAAVEAADGQALEIATCVAIHSFVKGCKADGTWPAIKASCILAGARTLAGALVPLVGAAPTNFNFVAADYNRKTGLIGNGSIKYLNSNRANNADPQNSKHYAVFLSTATTSDTVAIGATQTTPTTSVSQMYNSSGSIICTVNDASQALSLPSSAGFIGLSRPRSFGVDGRTNSNNYTTNAASSVAPSSLSHFVFARNLNGSPASYTSARLAFYSIGEALNLALLDTRVTTLINALAIAIP